MASSRRFAHRIVSCEPVMFVIRLGVFSRTRSVCAHLAAVARLSSARRPTGLPSRTARILVVPFCSCILVRILRGVGFVACALSRWHLPEPVECCLPVVTSAVSAGVMQNSLPNGRSEPVSPGLSRLMPARSKQQVRQSACCSRWRSSPAPHARRSIADGKV